MTEIYESTDGGGTPVPLKCTWLQPLKNIAFVGGAYVIMSLSSQIVEFDNINDLNYEELFSCDDFNDAKYMQDIINIRDIIFELNDEFLPHTLSMSVVKKMVFQFNKPVKKFFQA
jgi:hypothetical protein